MSSVYTDRQYGLYSTMSWIPKRENEDGIVWEKKPSEAGQKGRRSTQYVTEGMYADYESGLSIADVAEKWGVHQQTVYYRFRNADLPLRTAASVGSGMYFDYCTGMSLGEVAAKWGYAVQTVRIQFKSMGLPLRSRSVGYKHHPNRNPSMGKCGSLEAANRLRAESTGEMRVAQCQEALRRITDEKVRELLCLRIDYPHASLSELAAMCDPPRTKHSVAAALRRALDWSAS